MKPQVAVAVCLLFLGFFFVVATRGEDNIAIQWSALLHKVLKSGGTKGPNREAVVGQNRAVFTLTSCMYDTWAVYDSKALASTIRSGSLGTMPRRQGSEQDRIKAIAYAAKAAWDYLFEDDSDGKSQGDSLFSSLGYSVDTNTDLNNPAGVGNYMCKIVIAERKLDGTNSEGNYPTTIPAGVPFADYTGYHAVNDPQPAVGYTNCSNVRAIHKWLPLRISATEVQHSSVPYMARVKPFALTSNTQFPLKSPPLPNTPRNQEWRDAFADVIKVSAALDDIAKITAEYNAQVGEGFIFQGYTIDAARNQNLNLEQSIKLLWAQGVAIWDNVISVWTYKYIWDTARPVTVIPCLYAGQTIKAWQGRYRGTGDIPASKFQSWVPTPNFPEFSSGHSSFSAASAQVLRSFFGSDRFLGQAIVFAEGSSTIEPKVTDPKDPKYLAGFSDKPNTGPGTPGYVPAKEITIQYSTWSEAAAATGKSGLYGGVHIQQSIDASAELGNNIGTEAWKVCNSLWNPTSTSTSTSGGGDGDGDEESLGLGLGLGLGIPLLLLFIVVGLAFLVYFYNATREEVPAPNAPYRQLKDDKL